MPTTDAGLAPLDASARLTVFTGVEKRHIVKEGVPMVAQLSGNGTLIDGNGGKPFANGKDIRAA